MIRQDLSKLKAELVNLLAMADQYNTLLAEVGHHTLRKVWSISMYLTTLLQSSM